MDKPNFFSSFSHLASNNLDDPLSICINASVFRLISVRLLICTLVLFNVSIILA